LPFGPLQGSLPGFSNCPGSTFRDREAKLDDHGQNQWYEEEFSPAEKESL